MKEQSMADPRNPIRDVRPALTDYVRATL